MKRYLIFIILLIGIVTSIEAQTFQVTDMQFGNNVSESTKQKKKSQGLGTLAKLNVYDNDAKLELLSSDGDTEASIILERQTDGNYVYKEGEDKVILKIDSFLGYYRALKLETWRDNQLMWTTYLKRK